MKIVVLGLASDDIGPELRGLQVLFGDAIQSALERASITSNIETLFFTPIVTRPGIGPFPDKISYLRNEPSVNAAINLSYQQWTENGRIEHVNMVAQALIRTIDQIRGTKLGSEAKADLRRVVEDVRKSLTETLA
jgi:hypothetical protein